MFWINLVMKKTYLNHFKNNNGQFKIAVTFLTVYNGIFNIRNRNNNSYFKKALIDEDFLNFRIPPGAYEIKSLDKEIRRNIFNDGYYTEANYPFKRKPSFSTRGSNIGISSPGPVITFVPDDSRRNLLGFSRTTLFEEYN